MTRTFQTNLKFSLRFANAKNEKIRRDNIQNKNKVVYVSSMSNLNLLISENDAYSEKI